MTHCIALICKAWLPSSLLLENESHVEKKWKKKKNTFQKKRKKTKTTKISTIYLELHELCLIYHLHFQSLGRQTDLSESPSWSKVPLLINAYSGLSYEDNVPPPH